MSNALKTILNKLLYIMKKLFTYFSNLRGSLAALQSTDVRVRDGQQPTNLQLISNLSLTLTPFRLAKWVAVLCLLVTLGVGNVWGADPVATATATSGKSYVIAYWNGTKYIALDPSKVGTSASTFEGTDVTVDANGKVTTANPPLWTLTVNPSQSTQFYISCVINNTTYYLYKNGTSGTTNYNIKRVASGQHYWTFSKSSNKYSIKSERGSACQYLYYYTTGGKWEVYSSSTASLLLLEPAPTITCATSSLSGFTYVQGSGPSSAQTFSVSGSYLTANITVTAPTNYEVSTSSGSGYGNSVTFTPSSGSVAATTVYVRLKSGLSAGSYTGTSITMSSTGAANKTISLSGSVTASCSANPTIGNASLNGSISLTSFPLSVSSVGGGTNCTLAEYGFVWKAGSNPSASDNKTKIGESSSATSFTGNITGSFSMGVTYYIKGYAINNGPNTMLSATALTITPRSVTFNSNGGSAVDTKYVNSGTKVTAPSDPTKTGYNFGEWQLNSSEFDFANTNVISNITLVATWTAKTTTVSFNQTSGTGGQTGTLTATYGSAMPSAPVTCPTRTGYDFGGYYDGSGGTGTQYYTSTGASARTWNKEDATYTLHAKWTIKNYTITWKVNGETWSDKGGSTNANYNTAWSSLTLPTAPDPENDGCGQKFVGWTTTENYSNATTAPSDLLNADNKSGKTAVLITDNVEFHAVFADYDEP